MKAGRRLWNTASGVLVEDGDPRATTLAYGADDDLSEVHARQREAAAEPAEAEQVEQPAAESKAVRPAANKARSDREDKGR